MHPFRRQAATTAFVFGIVALSVFGAVACGNSTEQVSGERINDAAAVDGEATDSGLYDTESGEPETTPQDDASTDEGIEGAEGAEGDDPIDAEAEDGAMIEPELEPADINEVVPRIVNEVAYHDLSPEETECMVAETEESPELTNLVNAYDNPIAPPDEASVYEFSLAMQRCIAAEPLAFQVAQGWGFVGPGADEAAGAAGVTEPITMEELNTEEKATVECFTGQIEGPDGSAVYSTLFNRLLSFDSTPEAYEPTIKALSECAPTSAIAKNMAYTVEASSGFSSTVDVDCAADAVDDKREAFWTAVISNEGNGFEDVDAAIRECTTEIDDGLLDAPPDSWKPWSGDHTLAEVSPRARNDIYEAPPEMTIDPDGTYTAVIATGGGEIRLSLDAKNSPITVNNFVNLANDGFYDGLTFHRVLDGFMAQGGDPLGTGTGGPGYVFEDEVDNGLVFDKPGQLAMANSGPGTNGSQFFITFDATDFLDGAHTIFGEVTEGDDVLNAIERRDPATAQGLGQVIDSITIIEGE